MHLKLDRSAYLLIDLDLFFLYHAMPTNFVEKNGKLPSFVTLAFQNGMGYHYLNLHINSISDTSVLCKNFVNFGPVTPESTELICELLV